MQDKKTKTLILIIVFLLITNIGLLCFFIFGGNENSTAHGRNLNMVGTFLKDQIGFSDEQMNAYQKFKKDDFEKNKFFFDQLKSVKNGFYQNIYRSDVPDSILQKSALLIGEKQVAVDLRMLQHFKNLRALCTPRQLPKFDSLFTNIVEKITRGKFRNGNHH